MSLSVQMRRPFVIVNDDAGIINRGIELLAQVETAAASTEAASGFATRAALVSAIAGGLVPIAGATYRAAGVEYLGQSGATSIPDMPGLVPNGVTTPQHFGAFGDGVANERTAFQAAINFVLASGGGTIFVPRGTYWFPEGAKLDPGAGGVTFIGEGPDATILHYHEGSVVPAFIGSDHLFKNTANVPKKALVFRDLQIRGTLNETDRAGRWANPMFLDYYPDVLIENCKFLNIAGEGMDFHKGNRFTCVNNRFENIAADAIRARDYPNCFIDNNYILKNGDDAIAIHTSDVYAPTREGVSVTNNRIVNGGTIKILGGRVVNVTGNTQELGNIQGIEVADSSGYPEGNIPLRDIVVSNNVILDGFFTGLDGIPTGGIFAGILIVSRGPRGTPASGSAIPGDYSSSEAGFVYPWDFDENVTNLAASPVAKKHGIVIEGNVVRRSRPAVAAFTDYGFGKRIFQGVARDFAVTDAVLRMQAGVVLHGGISGASITGNIIEHVNNGISFAAPTVHRQYEGVVIQGNILFNCVNRGFLIVSASLAVDVLFQGNSLDCDPYRLNANSNLDGTYDADGLPRAVDIGNITGVKILSNTFRNTCRVVSANFPHRQVISNNILACQPVASVIGFSTLNKGIGFVPYIAGGYYRFEMIDADPTSATYGNHISDQALQAGAQPSTGTWVVGTFVQNILPAPDANNMVLTGWLRRTTGSGNVATTDWLPVYVSAVSPAV